MADLNKKRLLVNAIFSVAQVLLLVGIYFFLYRYLVKQLGTKELGVWSLVLATSSIANLANFGITSGLVKFVAEYKVNKSELDLTQLVSTSFYTICGFFLVLILILYFISVFVLKLVVDIEYLPLAQSILPFSLLSLFINGVGGVFTSVLEGFQKSYVRSMIYSFAMVVLYIFTLILTPSFGLLGVAYAQITQSLVVSISAIILTSKYYKFSQFKWNKHIFRDIMSYGLKFQIVSICQLVYEPTTKALLSKFGGLSMVGYYEMAAKMVSQIRGLVVNANQVVIPAITEASYKEAGELEKIYKKTFALTVLISFPMILGALLFSPLISIVWIGKLEIPFVIFTYVLGIANLANINCGPSYFGFLGQGTLNPLIAVHALIAILNLLLSFVLGYYFSSYGVAVAWAIALSLSSVLLIYIYNKKNSFNLKGAYNKRLVVGSLVFLVILPIGFYQTINILDESYRLIMFLVALLLYFIFFGYFIFKDKEVRKIINLVYKR